MATYNEEVMRDRANAVQASRVHQRTLTLLETYESDYYQKKEEKWTREWALAEMARQRGFQFRRRSALKIYEAIAWPKRDHCCDETCRQYSNRSTEKIYRFDSTKSMKARNNVWVCMETGSVHVCDISRCGKEYTISGRNPRLGSACLISGKLKAPLLSMVRFGDNGIHSTKRMAKAEQEEDMAMREDASQESAHNTEEESSGSNSDQEEELNDQMDVHLPHPKRMRLKHSALAVIALQRAEKEIAAMQLLPNEQFQRITAYSTSSKGMRSRMNELRILTTNEKKRKQAEEPTFSFTKARVVTVHQTLEQKQLRHLKRGALHLAVNFVDLLMAADTKNRLAFYRMERMNSEVTRTLADLLRQYQISKDIAVGVYYRLMRNATEMEFCYMPSTLDSKFYCKYIMAHWNAAAETISLTPAKQKHSQVMNFQLFCIGMIYCMAEGGITLEEKIELDRLPAGVPGEKLKNFRLRVQAIPSFPELRPVLVNKEFLFELCKCVPGFPTFLVGVEENAFQLVQSYAMKRRKYIKAQFYSELAAEPTKLAQHLKLYAARSLPLPPAE